MVVKGKKEYDNILENWDWPLNRVYKLEYSCPHGIGHGEAVHGCDGCCGHESYRKAYGKRKLVKEILNEKKRRRK